MGSDAFGIPIIEMGKLRQENVPEVTKLLGVLILALRSQRPGSTSTPPGVSVVPMSPGWGSGLLQGSLSANGGIREKIVLCWLNS